MYRKLANIYVIVSLRKAGRIIIGKFENDKCLEKRTGCKKTFKNILNERYRTTY
jgi:hypothetical protein